MKYARGQRLVSRDGWWCMVEEDLSETKMWVRWEIGSLRQIVSKRIFDPRDQMPTMASGETWATVSVVGLRRLRFHG